MLSNKIKNMMCEYQNTQQNKCIFVGSSDYKAGYYQCFKNHINDIEAQEVLIKEMLVAMETVYNIYKDDSFNVASFIGIINKVKELIC